MVCETCAEGCYAKLGGLCGYNPAITVLNVQCCNPCRL